MQRRTRQLLCLMLVAMAVCSVRAAEPITPVLLTTFTNPVSGPSSGFGYGVAAVGEDKIVVGGSSVGGAFLYSRDGALLRAYTNPLPADLVSFGYQVAALGTDRLLVGGVRSGDGVVCLLATNGSLLTLFTNPTPAMYEAFGLPIAVLGEDLVAIGDRADGFPMSTGAVYLFSTNGNLLQTITNPTPAQGELFGYSIAAVGTNRVVVGAPGDDLGATNSGAAYLFDTTGQLLTVFTNPTPDGEEFFGSSLASVGGDKVLIGAPHDDTDLIGDAGAAYLFNIHGALLATFKNPTGERDTRFGHSVAAFGDDRILVGAFLDGWPKTNGGAAFLFAIDGTLLATIPNPTPGQHDRFGHLVGALAGDRAFISADADDTAGLDAGAVYLFDLLPRLGIAPSGDDVSIKWLGGDLDWVLQQADILGSTPPWTNTLELVTTNGLTNLVLQTVPAGVTNRFYRLRRP